MLSKTDDKCSQLVCNKLFHYHLSSYIVKKRVRPMLYYLKLQLILQRLYSVFNIVKLTTISKYSISNKYYSFPLDFIIINKEKE